MPWENNTKGHGEERPAFFGVRMGAFSLAGIWSPISFSRGKEILRGLPVVKIRRDRLPALFQW